MAEQGNLVRLNKDEMRKMLHNNKFSYANEEITRKMVRSMARELLINNINVIIDDTNLNTSTKQSWVDLAKECKAKIEHRDISLPIEDCISRDTLREDSVGEQVIYSMALQWLDYRKGEEVIVCDLDGTVADLSHRIHYIKDTDKKDYDSFFRYVFF